MILDWHKSQVSTTRRTFRLRFNRIFSGLSGKLGETTSNVLPGTKISVWRTTWILWKSNTCNRIYLIEISASP